MMTSRLIGRGFVFCLIFASFSSGTSIAQEEKKIYRHDNVIEMAHYIRIPEATEPSSTQESEWWSQIKKAHDDMLVGYQKRKEKVVADAKSRFLQLLYDGQMKSYRVPLQDRPSLQLVIGKQRYTYMALKHRTAGTVELSVQFQANGLVGDIQVIKGLENGLTESAIEATRQGIFLPAVKNRAFVAEQGNVKVRFFLGSENNQIDAASQARRVKH